MEWTPYEISGGSENNPYRDNDEKIEEYEDNPYRDNDENVGWRIYE